MGLARGENQKKKLFLLAEFLERETDSSHVVNMAKIQAYLSKQEISAERKSIYSDLNTLRELGYEIEYQREEPSGYYLVEHKFELAELKLLVEAVEASRFLSEQKTNDLIKKLESLCSRYEAGQLQRQVYVYDRVKSMNESIYYNVDQLHAAISANREIFFRYYEWSAEKKLIPRKNGEKYHVIPKMLVWFDENYYLVAIEAASGKKKHYRVDKMKEIEAGDVAPAGTKSDQDCNTAKFTRKTFGMFDGREVCVRFQAQQNLAGVLLDRFGTDIILRKQPDGTLLAGANVYVSNPFFGWVFGIPGLKIIGPEDVKKEYYAYLKEQLGQYQEMEEKNE